MPPHDLYVESRQFINRKAANATFGVDPKSSRHNLLTGVTSNRDILNLSSLEEGAKLLQGLEFSSNPKLEQYQAII